MKNKLMACAAFWLPTLALTGCGSQFGDKMVRAGMMSVETQWLWGEEW